MDIEILILFYEKPEQTIECIKSILPSKKTIRILNNNSSKSATKSLLKFINPYENIFYYHSSINLGISKGRNFLIRETNAEWLFLPDSDITISTPNWLDVLQNYQNEFSHIKAFSPKLYEVHEKRYAKFKIFIHENQKITEKYFETPPEYINTLLGGATFIKKSVFDKNGLFDEKLSTMEDYEFAIRCLLNNNELIVKIIPEITVRHNHKKAKKINDKKAILNRYNIKKAEETFSIIEKKHNIIFEHHWQYYHQQQLYQMVKKTIWHNFKKRLHYFYLNLKK